MEASLSFSAILAGLVDLDAMRHTRKNVSRQSVCLSGSAAPEAGDRSQSPLPKNITHQQERRLFRDLARVDPEFAEKINPFLEGLYNY
jgi:hypothetical protein